jgi:PKD repeat protein
LEVSLSPADTYPSALRATRLLVSALVGIAILMLAAPVEAQAKADFSWPTPVIVKKKVTFTAELDSSASHYEWDLDGDGTYGDVNGITADRTFNSVKTYVVGLRILDDQLNVVDTTTKEVVVSPAPSGGNAAPEASFAFFPAEPVAGLPVTFVSTSVDPDSPIPAGAQRWDLNGDGVFDEATGESATVTFPAPGMYPVSLQVTTNKRDVASLVLPVGAPVAGAVKAFSLMSPFPVVRIAGRTTRRGARIRRMSVDAPPGTAVKVRCHGRGCPFKSTSRTVSMRVRAGSLPPTRLTRVRRLEGRTLRTGAILRVFVTRSDVIGKYTRFRIRRSKPPARQDLCMVPGTTKPAPCPSR